MIFRNLFRVPGTFSNSQGRLKKPPSSVAYGPDKSIALIFVALKSIFGCYRRQLLYSEIYRG
jgi:hypothetical protein